MYSSEFMNLGLTFKFVYIHITISKQTRADWSWNDLLYLAAKQSQVYFIEHLALRKTD